MLTAVQRQTAVTAYLKSKQLLLFAFELQDSLLPSSTGMLTAVQRQTAVTAYLKSKQLLLFAFARQIGSRQLYNPFRVKYASPPHGGQYNHRHIG